MSRNNLIPGVSTMSLMRKLRLERGMTQRDLAGYCGNGVLLHRTEVCNIENHGLETTVGTERLGLALSFFARMLGYEGDPCDLLEEVIY